MRCAHRDLDVMLWFWYGVELSSSSLDFLLVFFFFLLSSAARATSHRSVAPLVSGGVRTRRKTRDGLDRSDGGGGCGGCSPSHHAAGRGRRATQPGHALPGLLPCGRTGTITLTNSRTKSKSEPLAWGLGMGEMGAFSRVIRRAFFAGRCCDVKSTRWSMSPCPGPCWETYLSSEQRRQRTIGPLDALTRY